MCESHLRSYVPLRPGIVSKTLLRDQPGTYKGSDTQSSLKELNRQHHPEIKEGNAPREARQCHPALSMSASSSESRNIMKQRHTSGLIDKVRENKPVDYQPRSG